MADDSHYLWEVERCPLAVELRFSLIEQLNQRTPGEASGALFGRWKDNRTIALDDCAPSPGLTEVGYFRIRDAAGPPLDTADRNLIGGKFRGRPAVALAIRRNVTNPTRAAFFFWDGKALDSSFSMLPFPFDRELLLSEGHPIVHAESGPSGETAREIPHPATRAPRFRMSWKRLATEVGLFTAAALIVAAGAYLSTHVGTGRAPVQVEAVTAPVSPPVPQAVPQPDLEMRPPLREPPPPAVKVPVAPRQASAEISLQPVRQSFFGKTIRYVPILSHFRPNRDKDGFVPARPLRRAQLHVPPELGRYIDRDIPVDLRIRITPSGAVAESELVSPDENPAFSRLAMRAATHWNFEPARVRDRPVPSDMLVHFRFRPAAQ
jgi:TonB family protein